MKQVLTILCWIFIVVSFLAAGLQALDDWVRTYAPEFCDAQAVAEARQRIDEAGGTLAYIADVKRLVTRG